VLKAAQVKGVTPCIVQVLHGRLCFSHSHKRGVPNGHYTATVHTGLLLRNNRTMYRVGLFRGVYKQKTEKKTKILPDPAGQGSADGQWPGQS
jgi:hypothetical protein